MSRERLVLILIWIIGVAVTAVFVRRSNWHKFAASYLLCQCFTWINVTLQVKLGFVTYPVREFPKATDMGFSLQYLLYPVVCGLYILSGPRQGFFKKALYQLPWTFGMTCFHVALGEYTNLVHFNSNPFLRVWIILTVIFTLVQLFSQWFFKEAKSLQAEETAV
jgi:hypothetical protein